MEEGAFDLLSAGWRSARLICYWCWQDGGGAELRQWVEQYEEEQQRIYEEQSVLALEDRKSALLRAMSSPGESIIMMMFHLSL